MTTKSKENVEKNFTTVSSPPALFNIQYPHCRRGMFSLRRPFPNGSTNIQHEPIEHFAKRSAHPEYLQIDQNHHRNPVVSSSRSFQQDAQTQCSLPMIDDRDEIVLRRHPTFVRHRSPRYRVQLQLQPARPNIYQVWEVNTPPARTLPPVNRRIRLHSSRLVNVRSLSDDESFSSDETNDDDGILYARRCPRNLRCVCSHTISY